MAALQKIRNRGAMLIAVIGLALFAFIAEEFFRSLETTKNEGKNQAGEVYGEKLSAQDFQNNVEEFSEVYKMQSGRQSLTDEEMDGIRDQVWEEYVNYKFIEHETDKLGMTVTDEEMQNVLKEGTNRTLLQLVANTPFINQQTGTFDINLLQNFKKQVKELQTKGTQISQDQVDAINKLSALWSFTEKELRKQLLMTKYQVLLYSASLSNPIAAKMEFRERTEQSNLQLAAVPYTSISDKAVKVTDEDLKAKYEEQKEKFYTPFETRNIKYIDVAVAASKADKDALNNKMNETFAKLQTATDPASVVNASQSTVKYANLPLSKKAFPQDIQNELDSVAAGSTKAPYYSAYDNTMNIVKLVSKIEAPDSVQFRAIQVVAETTDQSKTKADSIMKALQSGADFEAIAKKYGQTGEKTWLTSKEYEGSNVDEDGAKYLTALNTLDVNGISNVALNQGNIILQVVDRKAMTTKYNAAIVKCPVTFSTTTYQAELNRFNVFLSKNKTLAQMEKNAAKNGYTVKTSDYTSSNGHNVGGVTGTKDVIKWIFDEAEEGDVSKLFECGPQNDHLMVVSMLKVNEKGYLPIDDKQVKQYLTQLVMNDKKAEMIMAKYKGVTSVAQAQQKGAIVAPLQNVVFANAPMVAATGSMEPAIAGRAFAMKAGAFSGAVKGNGGVFFFQVVNKTQAPEKFDAAAEENYIAQNNLRYIFGDPQRGIQAQFQADLLRKAKVVDHRYKF